MRSCQLTFDVSDSVFGVSRLGDALIVFPKTLLGFFKPEVINLLVLTRLEALDQTKGKPRSVSMRQFRRLLFNACFIAFHRPTVDRWLRGVNPGIVRFARLVT